MRLKQLRINGFKSFADTTVIDFPSAVSGIVGPNGCGKSNVIDAIRWVLGEARVSELRGLSTMSELIFAGSSRRPRSSRASVEMVLDNSDGSIAGAWGRYTELSVKRVVTRDGSNVYLINNQQVRRRDIQDIFMGTGLGPRSYAIISQGMISNFIKAKPEELRVYLEEAAGVSKYKERRRETETALNTTRSNLEKVAYLQQSKAAEIERLTVEAEVAERWRSLEDERKTAELLWYFVQEADQTAEINRINARIEEKNLAVLQMKGEVQRLLAQSDSLREEARRRSLVRDEARKKAWEIEAGVTRLEGDIARIVQEKESIARQIASNTQLLERRREEGGRTRGLCEDLQKRIAGYGEELELLVEERAVREEAAEQARGLLEEATEAFEAARTQAVDCQQRVGVLNEKTHACAQRASELEARLEQITQQQRLAKEPDRERFEELAAELEERRAEVEELAATEETAAGDRDEAGEALEEARRTQVQAAGVLARVQAQLQTLEELQRNSEEQGKLTEWLQRMGLDSAERLFEKIDVQEEWAVALEAVLAERASAYPMRELRFAAGFAFDPPPGRVVFFGDGAVNKLPAIEGVRTLSECVTSADPTVAAALAVWLDGVYLADNLNEAVAARTKLPAAACFVTREGHTVDAVSVNYWAQEANTGASVSRTVRIRSLTAELEASGRTLNAADEALVRAKESLRGREAALITAQNNRRTAVDALHAAEMEHSRLAAQVAAFDEQKKRLDEDRRALRQAFEEAAAARDEAEALFGEADEALSRAQETMESARVRKSECEAARNRAEADAAQAGQNEKMLRLQQASDNERLAEAKARLAAGDEELGMIEAELEELAARREGLDETAQREGLGRILAEKDASADALRQAEAACAEAENSLENTRIRQTELTQAQQPVLEEISDLMVRREACVTNRDTFASRLEELGADRAELAQKAAADPVKAPTLKARVTRLAQEMAALGAVNHAALENLQACRKTMQETERQVADLEEAIANLTATIRKIDAETRDLLRSTFDAVNRNFGEMFRGLFGGGSAELRMSGDEILEAGVEVVAQPPGKRNASVRLLSGGEQAMTATALVFAIFKLNPAPFCLLDEVDAPLDEANQDRLARRIIEMSAGTQFMMITHHRVTMEHLGRLVGVTMKEPGVSRVVSVDVTQAVDLASQSAA
ncbi:MAG: chromosome segregation protein SMC [Duodenibacillus sp.]|nr:chromosome segregation protein SMC [Duodenibacillus sp.]